MLYVGCVCFNLCLFVVLCLYFCIFVLFGCYCVLFVGILFVCWYLAMSVISIGLSVADTFGRYCGYSLFCCFWSVLSYSLASRCVVIGAVQNMGKSKTVTTPSLLEDPPEDSLLLSEQDTTMFRSAVGTALYLTPDREGIHRDVQMLARAIQAHTDFDRKRLVRLVRYLKGTRTFGVLMKKPKGRAGHCQDGHVLGHGFCEL